MDSKLPDVGTSIFTVMSRLAEQCGAINLSQGFPDYQPPQPLIQRVMVHLEAGHNQYPPMAGVPALREAIARHLHRQYGALADPETEITVTSGATEALFCAIHAVVRAGERVVAFDPAYDSYEPAARLAGADTIRLPLDPPRFSIDWDRLETSLDDKTRLLIINSPHNPTGTLLDADDLNRLADLLRPHRCYILSDEVYEHIVFDGGRHATVLAHPELAARSFAVFSFGKTYHATGWKVGYCVAPAPLTAEFRRIHQFVTFATASPLQYALADFMTQHPEHCLGLSDFYQQKRDLFLDLLAESRFDLRPAGGTYFQLADYSAISDLPDRQFVRRLTEEQRVAAIPISVFYRNPPDTRLIRFCFAKEASTLEQAAKRLAAL